MELWRESAANLLEKLLNSKLRLLSSRREPAHGYRLSRIPDPLPNDDDNRDNVIAGAAAVGLNSIQGPPPPDTLCSRNAPFVNPPMFTLCSDSPSEMKKLRRDCLAGNEFMFAYGCLPHAILKPLYGSCEALCRCETGTEGGTVYGEDTQIIASPSSTLRQAIYREV